MGPISLGYFILFYFVNLHTIFIRDNVFFSKGLFDQGRWKCAFLWSCDLGCLICSFVSVI